MKLSVSIVTYQQERFIRQALESVLEQKLDHEFEVIVGDDASTDGTRAILHEMSVMAPGRVRLLLADSNHGDSGLSNFMATVDAARGEYIAFLDGDDFWTSPYKLQRQVDFLDRHSDCAICAHRVKHRLENGQVLLSPRPGRGEQKLSIDRLVVSNFAEKISVVIRRSAVEALPDWYRRTDAISADWLFNVLVGRVGKVGFIDEVMAVHRLHTDSLSIKHGTRRLLADKLETIRLLYPYLPDSRLALLKASYILRLKLGLLRLSSRSYMVMKRMNSGTFGWSGSPRQAVPGTSDGQAGDLDGDTMKGRLPGD